MPTLLNLNGFKLFFYANNHEPPHVHILKSGRWAKIEIRSAKVVHSSLKNQELKECQGILAKYEAEFLEKWYAWFNR